jgi:hypothetical protein
MGGSEAVSIEALTTGRALSVKTISHPIPGGIATLNRSFGFLGGEGNEQ